MCEWCHSLITDFNRMWKIYGKCFCSHKCVAAYEKENDVEDL